MDSTSEFFAEIDAEARAGRAGANGHAGSDDVFEFTIASSLAGKPPPERQWRVRDWIPDRQVTLLSGDGGVGKSLLALQLQLAGAMLMPWLGLETTPCRSFGIYAEDENDELHRRLYKIAGATGADIAALENMAWRSAVADHAELVEVDEQSGVRPTAYYHKVEKAALDFGARLVILDAATNLYGADEIRRRQVNSYIGLLRKLAIKIDGAVLLLAHPSAQGISTGSGLSGSTHWNNAVRSRLYFERANGENPDPDERTLKRVKANYAGTGDVLRLRWNDGAFVALDPPSGIDRIALSAKADRVFLALLSSTYANGSWTSPNPSSRNYAPSIFGKHPDRDGLGKPAFEAAMHRLLKSTQATTEDYGRPSDPHKRLALP